MLLSLDATHDFDTCHVSYNNLNEIVEKIFDEFDIYNHVLMLDNIESVELRLNHIKEMISNLVNLDYSVIEVIEYFDKLINASVG